MVLFRLHHDVALKWREVVSEKPHSELFTSNDPLEHIADKCHQYVNAQHIGIEEFHAILGFIWRKTDDVEKELEVLRELAEAAVNVCCDVAGSADHPRASVRREDLNLLIEKSLHWKGEEWWRKLKEVEDGE